jgi:PleD family two-component response regulator
VYNERVKERSEREQRTPEQSSSLVPRKMNKHDKHNDTPSVLLKILIVEDSLSILKVVCHMLRQKGHTVESAHNGSLGLDMMIQGYNAGACDVVLMELLMLFLYLYFNIHV